MRTIPASFFWGQSYALSSPTHMVVNELFMGSGSLLISLTMLVSRHSTYTGYSLLYRTMSRVPNWYRIYRPDPSSPSGHTWLPPFLDRSSVRIQPCVIGL
ncbi:hypothetical protein DL93DRAFT_1056931 [Clavulina sp. PMI_390]|nr:hypothetical protein DL93DRAFT_1056931 [Clavulina sp. PMI_390]